MFELSKSFLTFSLKKENLYASAFESFLLFGQVKSKKYQETYFVFASCELSLLFNTVVCLVQFFSQENEVSHPSTFIKSFENIRYEWLGKTTSENKKLIDLMCHQSSNSTSVISLQIEDIHVLIKALRMLYFCTLNITTEQKFFLDFIAKKTIIELESIHDNQRLFSTLVKHFYEKFNNNDNEYELYQLYMFYYEEILIISKLNLML